MYAALGWLFLADSTDMPKDGASALPVCEESPLGRQVTVITLTPKGEQARVSTKGEVA